MKIFSFLSIIIGAILVFTFDNEEQWHIYVKTFGFILMMFGLYRSTQIWVKDNPREENKEDFNQKEER